MQLAQCMLQQEALEHPAMSHTALKYVTKLDFKRLNATWITITIFFSLLYIYCTVPYSTVYCTFIHISSAQTVYFTRKYLVFHSTGGRI